jgi:hypothetical protein
LIVSITLVAYQRDSFSFGGDNRLISMTIHHHHRFKSFTKNTAQEKVLFEKCFLRNYLLTNGSIGMLYSAIHNDGLSIRETS